jgi:hypothetical protein
MRLNACITKGEICISEKATLTHTQPLHTAKKAKRKTEHGFIELTNSIKAPQNIN